MEPGVSSGKRILIAGGILLVIVLAIISAYLSNRHKASPKNLAPTETTKTTSKDVGDILAYKPPADAIYTALGDVNFLPEEVNGIKIEREKVVLQARASHPDLAEQDLIKLININLFNFLAMNSFYEKNGQPTSSLYDGKHIASYTQLESEVNRQGVEYAKKLMTLNGFFIQVRFANVRPENITKLGKKESDLRQLAGDLMDKYVTAAKTFNDKSRVVDFINADEQVKLLNDSNMSARFSDYRLYQPLIGDPNFYSFIQSAPVGNFSQTMTIKQHVPDQANLQDVGFAVFYVKGKSGSYLPLEVIRDEYITNAKLS